MMVQIQNENKKYIVKHFTVQLSNEFQIGKFEVEG